LTSNPCDEETVRVMSSMPLKRRDLLAGCGVLVLMPTVALAQPTTARRLHLRNEHTGETFDGPYRDAAGPLPDAMAEPAKLLRDHHADKVGPVDVGTLDLLADIMEAVGQGKATVLSAFRTPETNARLASKGLGVAEHSQHLLGKALRRHFPGAPARRASHGPRPQARWCGLVPALLPPYRHGTGAELEDVRPRSEQPLRPVGQGPPSDGRRPYENSPRDRPPTLVRRSLTGDERLFR
jgi:uncharacterized protein YcbK (DUF882 family)